MREEQTISLSVVQETTDTPVRGPTYGEAMVLTAPDLGPGYGQVAIVTDEDGAVSIHYPVDDVDTQAPQPTATRGVGGEKVFVLRARVPPVAPDDGVPATRGLAGTIGRKLIQVVAFPVVEMAVRAGGSLVRSWEDDHRPHRLRHFGPADFSRALTDPWNGDDWGRLAGGPALVFVHGTFSTAHGAFGGLPPTVIDELHRRYEGRILAFDHPSLSMTPEENVGWLLDQLPGGATLEVDLVCHSRGGLVGRALAGELGDVDRSPVRVRRVVFVGTPNEGTALADPEHLAVLLDRMATVANLFPGVPVAEVLDAVLSVVNALAQGALTGLEGLAAMRPGGDFLTRLSGGPDVEAEYFALASDFEPTRPGLKGLGARRPRLVPRLGVPGRGQRPRGPHPWRVVGLRRRKCHRRRQPGRVRPGPWGHPLHVLAGTGDRRPAARLAARLSGCSRLQGASSRVCHWLGQCLAASRSGLLLRLPRRLPSSATSDTVKMVP